MIYCVHSVVGLITMATKKESWINLDWLAKSRWTTDKEKRLFVHTGKMNGQCLKQIIVLITCRVKLTYLLFLCALHFEHFLLLSHVLPFLFHVKWLYHISWIRLCYFCNLTYFLRIKIVRIKRCFGHCSFLAYCRLTNC